MDGSFRNKWLGAAGFLLERRRGLPSPGESFDAEIAEAGLDDADAGDVEAEVIRRLESDDLDADDRQTAYWALSKAGHDRHLAFLQGRLACELGNMRVAVQAMYALGACGEAVFASDRSGVSFDEDELNRRDALEYLARLL